MSIVREGRNSFIPWGLHEVLIGGKQWGPVGRSSRRQILSSHEKKPLVLSLLFSVVLGTGRHWDGPRQSSCPHRAPMKLGEMYLKENHPRNECCSLNCPGQVEAALTGVHSLSLEFSREMCLARGFLCSEKGGVRNFSWASVCVLLRVLQNLQQP